MLFGRLGAPLGASGVKLGWFGCEFWGTLIFDSLLERFGQPQGCPKGGILAAKKKQKSIPNRGANLRVNKSHLGAVLDRFELDLRTVLGSTMSFFHGLFQVVCEHHNF